MNKKLHCFVLENLPSTKELVDDAVSRGKGIMDYYMTEEDLNGLRAFDSNFTINHGKLVYSIPGPSFLASDEFAYALFDSFPQSIISIDSDAVLQDMHLLQLYEAALELEKMREEIYVSSQKKYRVKNITNIPTNVVQFRLRGALKHDSNNRH